MMVIINDIEKTVLSHLQEDIPIEERPFSVIATHLGIPETSLLRIIKELKERKIIRQISPIYDTRRLGYKSLLVAFKVSPENLEEAARLVNSHPGVSHNYERDHIFNLWFTIAIPPESKFGPERTIEILANKTGVREYVILRAKRVFKIGLKLDMDGTGSEVERNPLTTEFTFPTKKVPTSLTEEDRDIIRITQEDMPLIENPFHALSSILGVKQEYLIEKLKDYRKNGIMRRFSAVLYHRNAGFKANGMVVWRIPEDSVEKVGKRIASYKAVSHCYERTTNGVWPYNLFCMLHAKTPEEIEKVVREISYNTGINDFAVLFSKREFKKKRVRYFMEDFYTWEDAQG